jgi:hypothetical protein
VALDNDLGVAKPLGVRPRINEAFLDGVTIDDERDCSRVWTKGREIDAVRKRDRSHRETASGFDGKIHQHSFAGAKTIS